MLRLVLFEGDRKLWEIPLRARDWERSRLTKELRQLQKNIEKMELLFNAMSNTGRIQMMCRLFESDDSVAFTELMNSLKMNPKIVSDSTKRLRKTGLIKKDKQGRYRPTNKGEAQFMMMSIALRNMMKMLDELM